MDAPAIKCSATVIPYPGLYQPSDAHRFAKGKAREFLFLERLGELVRDQQMIGADVLVTPGMIAIFGDFENVASLRTPYDGIAR